MGPTDDVHRPNAIRARRIVEIASDVHDVEDLIDHASQSP
jgi:hypothetical protein